MATISGRVIFDRDRSATISGGDSGLANIPVVLQNISTSLRLTVLTDSAGNYSFINVPNGEYRIVESYGTTGGFATPGDFSLAEPGSIPQGINPPITAAGNPPAGATNLDSVTPDTLYVTVTSAGLSNQNFLNGPVIYTPVQTILDPCAVISGSNLIQAADNGTFGFFPQGTPANTGAPTEPYPGVTPDFTYVLPNPDTYTPFGGQYTVQNIMNNALSQAIGAWWRIADHTTGTETGRMMVVNGDNPGTVFFRDIVTVQPNTSYLFTAWILNLFKVTGYPDPQLGVRVLDENGGILYSATLGALIPPNLNAPEWKQIGSVVNSRNNTHLTVEFLSEGPEVIGNDYAIDDISFNEIQVPRFIPVKTVDRQTANVGETVRFTVTLTNTCQSPLTSLFFRDVIPDGLSFVPGSVTVNGISFAGNNPNFGFDLPDVPGGGTATVSFEALVYAVPNPNPALNQAAVDYSYTPVEGGIPGRYNVTSNEVPVEVAANADVAVVKTASPVPVEPGSTLTYTIGVTNRGPSPAENVRLTDAVPPVLSMVEFSTDNGFTWQSWSGSYEIGTLANGASRTILIRGLVASSAAGSIINTAAVTSTTPDPDLSNNTSTTETPVVEQADISVVKLGSPNPVTPGGLLTYTVTVSNAGPGAAVNTTLTDNVPAQLTNVEFSTDNGVTFRPWGGILSLGVLEPGFVLNVLIRGTVSPSASGTITNTAVVNSTTPDPNPDNNTSTENTPVTASADLSVTKSGSPSPVAAGSQLTYTVVAANHGPGDAQNVTLTDSLPAQIRNPEYSLDGGFTFQPWTGSASLGSLAEGASRTVIIRGIVNETAVGTITNTVTVSSTTPDPNPDNNQDTEITPINTSADLSIAKTGSPIPATPGQYLFYTIRVENNGPNPAVNTVVTDTVPSSLTNVEYSIDSGTAWNPWTGSYSLGTLAPGAVQTILLRGLVSLSAPDIITNTALVSSDTPDPNPDNNQDTAIIPVRESADLSLSKTAYPVPVNAGELLTYTLVISNAGPNAAQNVELSDMLPSGLINPEFAVQGSSNFIPWTSPYAVGTLAAGGTFTVTIRGTVNPSASNGTLTNTAVVSSTTPDPNPDNNTDTTETPVISAADVIVSKTADFSPGLPGQPFSYTITVTNAGPSDARSVTLIDAVPSILQNPVVSLDNGATYFAWTSPITLGILAAHTSRTILIRGILSPAAAGEIINTAVAESTTPDPNPDNNTSTDRTPIRAFADLSIIKTAEPSPVPAGGEIKYTLLISNAGPSQAEQVILTDTLPSELRNAEISADGGITWSPFNGTWQIGTLAAGASILFLIRAQVCPCAIGTIRNTASVSSDTYDPDLDNNTSTADIQAVPSADLSITKSSAPNPARPGSLLTYTLTVSNAGPSTASNVLIQDNIPSELINPEFSVDGGTSWQPWSNIYRLGTLSPGAVFTILIRAVIGSRPNGSLTNFAVVTSDTPDPDTSNNIDRNTTDIINGAVSDISVTKRACPGVAVPGERLTYTIIVTNHGPDPAERTVLYDEVSPDLSGVEFSVDGGATWNTWSNPYSLGRLEAGESATILIRGTVTSSACNTVNNTAVAASSNPDPNPDNNTDSTFTPVQKGADLSIRKTACVTASDCAPRITFTLSVSNAGPETARQVVITDTLPCEICSPSYSTDQGRTWCPWTGSLTVRELPPGSCLCILIRGTVSPCSACCIVNTAAVSSLTPDPDTRNNTACVTVRLPGSGCGFTPD